MVGAHVLRSHRALVCTYRPRLPRHLTAAFPCHGVSLPRKVHACYAPLTAANAAAAAAAAARPDNEDKDKSKPAQVQVSRPALPCDKPLPLANVMEVQRLLYLLEAPDYCLREFREHGVNGQDLMSLSEEDLEDGRFRFPRHVARKVFRIVTAWRTFQGITRDVTRSAITMPEYVDYYGYNSSPEARRQLEAAYRAVDANFNGTLTFEEFLVGFSLLDAAVAETRRAPARRGSGGGGFGG